MPVVKENEKMPSWCELEGYRFITLKAGDSVVLDEKADKRRLLVCEGSIKGDNAGTPVECKRQQDYANFFEWIKYALIDQGNGALKVEATSDSLLCYLWGHWGEEVGGCGLFPVWKNDNPVNPGTPTDYPRNTSFDNHYHDCDEYWILFRGKGVAYSEGKRYEVGPGDCIITGMGHHHDFPWVDEPVMAVFFETTMMGQKRLGHLWEHKDGPAVPQPDRV